MAKASKGSESDTPEMEWAYVCSCGFKSQKPLIYGGHIAAWNRKEPGKHLPRGKINLKTGEVLLPPVKDRTLEQKKAVDDVSRQKRRAAREAARYSASQFTTVLAQAQQIQFVPRIVTVDFSPIMRSAFECSRALWGWDLEFGDFLDTWFYNSFKEHGVTLTSYIVDEDEEERVAREALLQGNGHIEDEDTAVSAEAED